LEPEEPTNKRGILVPIASTPTINRPLAAADGNSKGSNPGGNSKGGNSGGSSTGQMKDRVGSSNENDENESEDEGEDDPLVVINKSKKTSFSRELAGLDGNLGSAWEAPADSHRRKSRTDHCRRRSGQLEIESADAD
jgi:hypothetical protein